MRLPGLKIPDAALQIPARIRDALKSRYKGSSVIASGITGLVVMLFLFASLLGSEAPEDASTVIKIGASLDGRAGAAGNAVSLIAANGAVISDPQLIEMSADGPLPKIANDGRTPMTVYSRRIDKSDPRPKIVVIVGGLGLSASLTQAAIDMLPPGITLSFTPYGSSLQGMVSAARASGHEVVMEVPLEPYDYPNNDPGQNTLLAEAAVKDNLARLQWVLSRFTGYAGLINNQGSKYLASLNDTQLLFAATQKRGLYFLDSGVSDQSIATDAARNIGTAFARVDISIDQTPAKDMIEKQLGELEKQAQQKGLAIGVAAAYPITLERLKAWSMGLEQKGIVLIPASAVVVAQKVTPRPVLPQTASPAHDTATTHLPVDEHSKAGPHP